MTGTPSTLVNRIRVTSIRSLELIVVEAGSQILDPVTGETQIVEHDKGVIGNNAIFCTKEQALIMNNIGDE